jgi:hypothetical protein
LIRARQTVPKVELAGLYDYNVIMRGRKATFALIALISITLICIGRCRADVEWVSPNRLYEIKDNPAVGFFQRIISVAVSEKDGAIYVLAGPPYGIYTYHSDNGAPWKRIHLDEPADPADRVCPCGGRLWFVHKKQLFEIADNGKPVPPGNPPAPLPDTVGDIACDPADRLLIVNGARTELRRYDEKGKQNLRIGPPEKNAASPQKPAAKAAPAPRSNSINAIALDAFNRIFILDSRARSIFSFDQKGKPMKPISDDQFADISFPFNSPSIAIDTDRNIWVVNPQENTLDAYSSFGSLKKRIGKNGANTSNFEFPFVAPAQIFIDAHDRLYVIDSAESAVKVFDLKSK